MKTFKTLEKNFYRDVKKLQDLHKCNYNTLKLENNSSGVGAGSTYPRIDITCKTCNKWWVIFRGDRNPFKTSPKIKKVLNHMLKNDLARCWLEDYDQNNSIIKYKER